MPTLRYLVAATFLAAHALVAQSPSAPVVTVLHAARLWDGTGAAPITDAVVVVTGDHITAVGPASKVSIPSGAQRVDLLSHARTGLHRCARAFDWSPAQRPRRRPGSRQRLRELRRYPWCGPRAIDTARRFHVGAQRRCAEFRRHGAAPGDQCRSSARASYGSGGSRDRDHRRALR